jgi:hypothetical protein
MNGFFHSFPRRGGEKRGLAAMGTNAKETKRWKPRIKFRPFDNRDSRA